MAIDLLRETILSVDRVCDLVSKADQPMDGGKKQKRVHRTTVIRWFTEGVDGVQLEYSRIGRKLVSSAEALARFGEALAARRQSRTSRPTAKASRCRSREIATAEQRVRDAGI